MPTLVQQKKQAPVFCRYGQSNNVSWRQEFSAIGPIWEGGRERKQLRTHLSCACTPPAFLPAFRESSNVRFNVHAALCPSLPQLPLSCICRCILIEGNNSSLLAFGHCCLESSGCHRQINNQAGDKSSAHIPAHSKMSSVIWTLHTCSTATGTERHGSHSMRQPQALPSARQSCGLRWLEPCCRAFACL